MKKALLALLIFAVAMVAAEDITETTPLRLGPAIGITSTPLSFGYRLPFSGYQSLDIGVRIPEFYKNETGGVGFELGGSVGYNVPFRVEENIAFVVKPQFDLSFATEDFKLNDEDNNEFTLNRLIMRPGAFMGIEVFLEEVGVSDVNIALGFTAGMEFNIVDGNSSNAVSTFHVPKATWPFGPTVAIWWYF